MISPTVIATSLIFSPSTLATSYVGLDISTVAQVIPATTITPSTTISYVATTSRLVITTALPVATKPPELSCCEKANGLCEWIEPECDALDEDDRKKTVWDEDYCDEIHPDDMAEIQERFQMYNEMQKRQKFARVRIN